MLESWRELDGHGPRWERKVSALVSRLSFPVNRDINHVIFRRYWEDSSISESIAKIETELDNNPGRGRIERLTHDEFRYLGLHRSPSNK